MPKDKFSRKLDRRCRRWDKRVCRQIKKAVKWGKVLLICFTGLVYTLGMGLLFYKQVKERAQKAVTVK